MQEEAEAFALAIAHQKPAAYLEWLQTAEQVHETLYHMRQSAGIQLRMKRMKEQFPQTWKDQLETLGFDAFTEIPGTDLLPYL